jgi:catechol-2,3-dioxygenase
MFTIARLNHAALYVRDAQRSSRFYQETLGFVARQRSDQLVFLSTSANAENNHDLVLIGIEADESEPTGGHRLGLYHLAWEVESLPELAEARAALLAGGVLTSEKDHGSSLSLYAKDPDGNEFEVFWPVPREEWASRKTGPLDISNEMATRGLAAATL